MSMQTTFAWRLPVLAIPPILIAGFGPWDMWQASNGWGAWSESALFLWVLPAGALVRILTLWVTRPEWRARQPSTWLSYAVLSFLIPGVAGFMMAWAGWYPRGHYSPAQEILGIGAVYAIGFPLFLLGAWLGGLFGKWRIQRHPTGRLALRLERRQGPTP